MVDGILACRFFVFKKNISKVYTLMRYAAENHTPVQEAAKSYFFLFLKQSLLKFTVNHCEHRWNCKHQPTTI